MIKEINAMKELGVDHIAFGDLFLEDVRRYREEMLKPVGITPIFPLWGINTSELIYRFLSLGYRTITTCVDMTQLPEGFSGREITQQFLEDLPVEVDPCGENGNIIPLFLMALYLEAIQFKTGEKKLTNDIYTGQMRFCYTDLIPSKE